MGASHARTFAERGANVIVADIDTAGEDVARSIGSHAHFVRLDIGSQADWIRAIEEAEAHFGPIGVLVNNAATYASGPFSEATEADFERIVRVNQLGTFLGMQSIIPSMQRAQRGSIINIASGAALRGLSRAPLYSMSKFAVRGLTLSAVKDLASKGIRVNLIMPGPIDNTTMFALNSAAQIEEMRSRVPLGRLGDVIDVTHAVLFLASDEASFITGAQLTVDGGGTASV